MRILQQGQVIDPMSIQAGDVFSYRGYITKCTSKPKRGKYKDGSEYFSMNAGRLCGEMRCGWSMADIGFAEHSDFTPLDDKQIEMLKKVQAKKDPARFNYVQ